jgi:SAM-dependent methyltransferase
LVLKWVQRAVGKRILEIGCGNGGAGPEIVAAHPGRFYLGYDFSDQMVRLAQSRWGMPNCQYTSSVRQVNAAAEEVPFCLALALFTLHDHPKKNKTIKWIADCLQPDGFLGILDLCTKDLPRLTRLLHRGLGVMGSKTDPRLSRSWINGIAKDIEFRVIERHQICLDIEFPSAQDLLDYLDLFGICHGMDLPLGLEPKKYATTFGLLKNLCSRWKFPFRDKRLFVGYLIKAGGQQRDATPDPS